MCVSLALLLQELKINIDAINDGDQCVCQTKNYQKNVVEFKSTDEQAEKLVAHIMGKAFVKRVSPQCHNPQCATPQSQETPL